MSYDDFINMTMSNSTTYLSEWLIDYTNTQQPERYLAAAGGELKLDYTVLGMAVVTMGFLLIVAVIRHQIDHLARGNDIFQTVLEACYHELSTLGIVEATVFLLHKYYKNLDLETERVFAEVHFTLFFVVIFNAIMSILLYFLASRVARNQWVRMEAIDIDHYVAVRQSYEKVQEELEHLTTKTVKTTKNDHEAKKNKKIVMKNSSRMVSFDLRDDEHEHDNQHVQENKRETAETAENESILQRIAAFPTKIWRHYFLVRLFKKREKELLVQVRFHELRVHFIESYKLPPNFRVSNYLQLCLNDVFKNLIHISTLAWLILMAFTNIIFFLMGVVFFTTGSKQNINIALTSIFLGYLVLFIVLSLVVSQKMKQVFYRIVKDESWIDKISNANAANDNNDPRQMKMARSISLGNLSTVTVQPRMNQTEYFWDSNPNFIVTIAQLMQFGYAIAFSMLLVFSLQIQDRAFLQWQGYYLITPIICYIAFLIFWSNIMPTFTQCTSLGELVHQKHLVDIDARSKLDKVRRIRQDEIDNLLAEKEVTENMKKRRYPRKRQGSSASSNILTKFFGRGASKDDQAQPDDLDLSQQGSLSHSARLVKISEFVKQPTKDLPDSEILKRTKQRQRTRSISDGVAAMRLFSTQSALAQEALKDDPDSKLLSNEGFKGSIKELEFKSSPNDVFQKPVATERRRPRRKSISTGVLQMQSEKSNLFDEDNPVITGKRNSKNVKPPTLKPVHEEMLPSRLHHHTFLKKEFHAETVNDATQNVAVDTMYESESDDDLSIEHVPAIADIDDDQSVVSDISIKEKLSQIILSDKYVYANAIFGTMVAFFLLAVRIELILIDTCAMEDYGNTWNLSSRGSAFYGVVVLLCLFLVESSLTFFLFLRKDLKMVSAATFDIILSSICLGLFLWAEVERCCACYERAESSVCNDPSAFCCPEFGSRLCGGVGTIEPIVSIIVLRLFRFELGRWIVYCLGILQRVFGKADQEKDDESKFEIPVDNTKLSEIISTGNKPPKRIDFKHETGTIAELWVLALAEYPEIVEKHGMFSSLILEAMLGINPLPHDLKTPSSTDNQDSSEAKYAKNEVPLTVEAIIEAGKTKRPRRIERGVSALSVRSAGGSSAMENTIENEYNFLRPVASLVRSMRRCECIWKWMKSTNEEVWDLVDVVLTEHEIVWFNIQDDVTSWDEGQSQRKENIKNAISAKKGGKGLRLCDVADGREVLGRLELNDIDRIKIQRILPTSIDDPNHELSNDDFDAEDNHASISRRRMIKKEYWLGSESESHVYLPLEHHWKNVTEDRLRLHSKQGTLYLRFLVDMYEEIETKKNGALLWCESVSHLRGRRQLKQKLPHFGEDRDNELLDFIEVTENRNIEENEGVKWKKLREISQKFK